MPAGTAVKQIINKKSALWVWLVSYLSVLILPLAVSVIIYSTAISIIRDNAKEINTIALSQTKIAVDQIFSDIYAVGRRILNQEPVISLAYAERPLSSFKREKIGKLQAGLGEYAAQGNYFRKIYVYFSHGGFAATTEGLYGDESFHKDLEKEAGAGSPVKSWTEEGRQFQAYMAYSPPFSRTDKVIVIMSDTPARAVPNVVCVFVIDCKPLYKLLDNYGNGTEGEPRYLWLASPREGRMICPDASLQLAGELGLNFSADSGYPESLEGRSMAITALNSEMTGWALVSAIPLRQYAKELGIVRRVYLIFLLICLGAGVFISVVFARKNYRPIRKLSSILEASSIERQGKPGGHSEFDYLADTIVMLLEKKQGYEKEIDRQRTLLAEEKLVKMLRGTIYSLQAFEAACGEYGFSFSTGRFLVIGIAVNEYSGAIYQNENEASAEELIEMLHLAIGYVFAELLRHSGDCHPCRCDDSIFIIASRRGDNEDEPDTAWAENLKTVCRNGEAVIRERFSVKASVYISGVYSERESGAMNIHDAYKETIWGLSQIKDLHERETVMARQDILNGMPEDSDTVPLHAEIVRYINEHYANPNLSITLLADHFSLSKSYLFRVFKKGENCGILDYIHQRRVEEAKKLLRGSGAGINEIAAMIGYTNGLTFIRAFKRVEGVTPTVYRCVARTQPAAFYGS
jgi:AraC-like DNA-binding protein